MLLDDVIREGINQYYNSLMDSTFTKIVDNDWIEITTPYLNVHNDFIEIYVRNEKEGYLISDGGETIVDFIQSGFDSNDERINIISKNYGVEIKGKELIIQCEKDMFTISIHKLLYSIVCIDNLILLKKRLDDIIPPKIKKIPKPLDRKITR